MGRLLGKIGKAIEKAAQDVGKAAEKAVQDTGKTIEKAAHVTGHTLEKAAQDTGKTIEKAAHITGHVLEKAAQDTGKTIEKAAHITGHVLEKAAQDTGKTIEKAAHDVGKTAEKAGQDIDWNARKAVRDTVDAGKAILRYAERTLKGYGDTLSDAERRIREGKIVDAFWHAAIDPLRNGEENISLAAKESELLRTVGSVAASVYGGPGGAAAYAAWLTYKETGDAEMALRVGIIAGSTSAAMGATGKLPANGAREIANKAALAGAVGGLAVAAAGGDEEAIKEGFLRSGGMVVIQSGYKDYTGHDLDPRASDREPFCMATVGASCSPDLEVYERTPTGDIKYDDSGKPVINMGRVPHGTAVVGMAATAESGTPIIGVTETSGTMVAVSKIPGMNAMAVFHDQWAISWEMPHGVLQATIVPAVVLTYNGTDAPFLELLRETAKDGAAKGDGASGEAPPVVATVVVAPVPPVVDGTAIPSAPQIPPPQPPA